MIKDMGMEKQFSEDDIKQAVLKNPHDL